MPSTSERLQQAIRQQLGESAVLRIIQENPSLVDMQEKFNGQTIMEHATDHWSWHCLEEIAKLTQADPEDNAGFGYALLAAIRFNKFSVILLLLEKGAKTTHKDRDHNNCLHLAILRTPESPELINIILKHDTNACYLTQTNTAGYTPLILAIQTQKLHIARMIVNHYLVAGAKLPLF